MVNTAADSLRSKTTAAPRGIQVISRAASILRVLSSQGSGLSLGQIATRVDLPRSTVQRIIQALVIEQMVSPLESGTGFVIGPGIQSLTSGVRSPVLNAAHSVIDTLSRDTGETVDLAEFRDSVMVFVDQIIGSHRLRTAATVGEAFPMTSTANGKACLALLADEDVLRLAKLEGKSSAEIDTLLREVGEIRSQGYALDIDEHTDGISAVGSAFHDVDGRVYAISIPVPTPRFHRHHDELLERLLIAITRIQRMRDR